MGVLSVATAVLLLSPVLHAHREGMESASHLSAMSGAAAAEAAYHADVHQKMVECQGVKHGAGRQGDTKESMQKMELCINQISTFAKDMQRQRQKSLDANKNYKDDIVLAKKILRYLSKKTDTHQSDFESYKQTEEQHLDEIHKMLKDREDEQAAQSASSMFQHNMMSGPLASDFYKPGNPGSYLTMNTMQTTMAHNPAMEPMSALQQSADVSQGSMAAMFTSRGQNLQLPRGLAEGLVGRRPSLLQLGGLGSGHTRRGSLLGGEVDGGLQAKLDNEAQNLEEADERDLRGGSDPDE